MWLVLCHTDDLPALWVHEGLKTRGLEPLELVSAESLAFSLQWEHRIATEGASIRITLADGRQISSERIFGAINRIQFAPMPHWRWASAPDKDYVQQELAAFYTSWLAGLPGPVLNPATAVGLSGAWYRQAQWMKLAAQAGLDAPAYHSGAAPAPAGHNRRKVIVAGGTVTGTGVPDAVVEGSRRLACLSKTPLLGIDFETQPSGAWQFAGATNMPDLRPGGAAVVDSLKSALENKGG